MGMQSEKATSSQVSSSELRDLCLKIEALEAKLDTRSNDTDKQSHNRKDRRYSNTGNKQFERRELEHNVGLCQI